VILLSIASTSAFAKSQKNPFDTLAEQVTMLLDRVGLIKTDVDGLKEENKTLKTNMDNLTNEVKMLKEEVEKLKNEPAEIPGEIETPKVITFSKDTFYNILDSSGNRVYTDFGINALQDYVFNREKDSLGIIGKVESLTGGTIVQVLAQKENSQWEIRLIVRNALNGVPAQLETVLYKFDQEMKSLYGNTSEDIVKTEIYYDGTFMKEPVGNIFKFTKQTISYLNNTVHFNNSYPDWNILGGEEERNSLVLGKSYYLGTYNNSGVWQAVAFDDAGKAYFFFWM
jgi:FtsZ-binding cell division protein ZapB